MRGTKVSEDDGAVTDEGTDDDEEDDGGTAKGDGDGGRDS